MGFGSHMCLLPQVREMTHFGIWGLVSQVPGEYCLFSLATRNPPIVQLEIISRYTNFQVGSIFSWPA